MLVIDPKECIDCGVCVDECPVRAIYTDEEVPQKWEDYIALNAHYAMVWPLIRDSRDPLPSAETFREIEDKKQYFTPNPAITAADDDVLE
jgi:ferredoxin